VRVRRQSAAPTHASWGKQVTSIVLYVTAIPAAYWRPAASLVLISTVAVMWLLPPKSIPAEEACGHLSAHKSPDKTS